MIEIFFYAKFTSQTKEIAAEMNWSLLCNWHLNREIEKSNIR